jgi:hypothetical protein
MALAPGDLVPGQLPLLTPDGEEVSLRSLLGGGDTLAIFLRHLG